MSETLRLPACPLLGGDTSQGSPTSSRRPWAAGALAPLLLSSILGCASTGSAEHRAPAGQADAVVSVAEDDVTWGQSDAPVTIVWFGDFLCRFTAKSAETIDQLEAEYGPGKLRVVWKSEPHPFEGREIELAEAGEVVRALGGSAAFWRFQRTAFAHQKDAATNLYADWARDAGVDPAVFAQRVATRAGAGKIARDHALAKELHVDATPEFFVNGKRIIGAQPIETFEEAIRSKLDKTARSERPPVGG